MAEPSRTDGERIVALEGRIAGAEADIAQNTRAINDVNAAMARGFAELRDLLTGRPSWAVVTLITLLSTTNGVLASAVIALILESRR
jgi:hypothetical protein